MQTHQESLPPINPRLFLAEKGESAFAALLRERAGYVPQEEPLIDFFECLGAEFPLLCEGGRGSGKTSFGEAIAKAFNLPLFYLQCMPQLTINQVLYTTDGTQGRLTRENVFLCDPLAAYDYCVSHGICPILLVDEIDKASLDVENMLLQILGRRYAHIPNLYPSSVVGIQDPEQPGPIVLITSNNLRELTEPMRSRCLYTYFRNPTAHEEVEIMRAQVPGVSADMLKQSLKVFHYIRSISAIPPERHPGLRESISFIKAVTRKGLEHLTIETLRRHLTYIGKSKDDRETLKMKLQLLESVARRSVPEIDRRVDKVFSTKPLEVLAAA